MKKKVVSKKPVKKKAVAKRKVVTKKCVAKKKDELNPKQRLFVAEYLKDFNGKRAAIAAGYEPNWAQITASRMLTMVKVKAAVNKAKAERIERIEIDSDWVLNRLVDEADADLADLYYKTGGIKPIHEWPVIWRKGLVAGIDVVTLGDGEGQIDKIRVSDRIKRIELIGKHVDVSAFEQRINMTSTLSEKTDEELKQIIKDYVES